MSWTDDPVRDAEAYYSSLEAKLERQPRCCACGEPIQEEKAVQIDGDWYCKEHENEAWERIRDDYLVKTCE